MIKTALCAIITFVCFNVHGQEVFNTPRYSQTADEFTRKVNDISYDIDVIIKNNKDKLKNELNEIEKRVENKELTKEEADKLRIEKAEIYAKLIEEETKEQEEKIKVLINNKIEDNINFSADMSAYQRKLIENKVLFVEELFFGNSTMLFDGKTNKDVYKPMAISSFGLSLGVKTRIGKETSHLFWKSDLGMTAHIFRLQHNRTIVDAGNETLLEEVPFETKSSGISFLDFRLSNYIEYDFSKKKYDDFGNQIIRSRKSFFVGLGGYVGLNSKMDAVLKYEMDGEEYTQTTNSRFNSERFIYGGGVYVGYKFISLKATYNFNQVFKKSFADQNIFNLSLAIQVI